LCAATYARVHTPASVQWRKLKASVRSTVKTRGQPAPPYLGRHGFALAGGDVGARHNLVEGAQVEIESKV